MIWEIVHENMTINYLSHGAGRYTELGTTAWTVRDLVRIPVIHRVPECIVSTTVPHKWTTSDHQPFVILLTISNGGMVYAAAAAVVVHWHFHHAIHSDKLSIVYLTE